jgi:photosystem II stability/assembly factor-like uncharacterized protein
MADENDRSAPETKHGFYKGEGPEIKEGGSQPATDTGPGRFSSLTDRLSGLADVIKAMARDRRKRWILVHITVVLALSATAYVQLSRSDLSKLADTSRPTPVQGAKNHEWWTSPLLWPPGPPLPSDTTFHIEDMAYSEAAQTVWAVGGFDPILSFKPFENGEGAGWEKKNSGRLAYAYLQDIQFIEGGERGWMLARQNTLGTKGFNGPSKNYSRLFATSDGGQNWTEIIERLPPLHSFHFVDEKNGWAVGDLGVTARTTDGGVSWKCEKLWGVSATVFEIIGGSGEGEKMKPNFPKWIDCREFSLSREKGDFRLKSVHYRDDSSIWAAGEKNRIFSIQRSRFRWSGSAGETFVEINDIFISDDLMTGISAGDSSLKVFNPQKPWETYNEYPGSFFKVVPLGDDLWVLGANGVIMHTDRERGFREFESRDSGVDCDLTAGVFMRSPEDESRVGWVSGRNCPVIATVDGGRTWVAPADVRAFPAPWYFAACLLSSLLLIPALRKPPPRMVARESLIEQLLFSDRAVESANEDFLDYGPEADRLARFIMNPNTTTPLTMAITGQWGKGKTSLMNLLRERLEDHHFKTVWFNAWHHQKEEYMLASLLEAIKKELIPKWNERVMPGFRLRLLKRRTERLYKDNYFPWLILVAFILGAVLARWDMTDFLQSIREITEKILARETVTTMDYLLLGLTVPFVSPLIIPLLLLYQGLKAFNIKPSVLLASLSGRAGAKELEDKTGFRHKFALEFGEVTYALGHRKPVIFIDDLDRCMPEKVVEVVECINFIVNSGDCFFVLGLDPGWVEPCVAVKFKEVAEELYACEMSEKHKKKKAAQKKPEQKTIEEKGKAKKRKEFAHNYLRKMINMEVPLPSPEVERIREMMFATRPKRKGRKIPAWLKAAVFLLAACLIAYAAVWLDEYRDRARKDISGSPLAAAKAESRTGPAEETIESRAEPVGEKPRGPAKLLELKQEEVPLQTARKVADSIPVSFAILLAIGAAAYAGSVRRETVHVIQLGDSEKYRETMLAFAPVVFVKHSTPRKLKRFGNWMRWVAMRKAPLQTGLASLRQPGKPHRDLAIKIKNILDEAGVQAPEEAVDSVAKAVYNGILHARHPHEELRYKRLVASAVREIRIKEGINNEQPIRSPLFDEEFIDDPGDIVREVFAEFLDKQTKVVNKDDPNFEVRLVDNLQNSAMEAVKESGDEKKTTSIPDEAIVGLGVINECCPEWLEKADVDVYIEFLKKLEDNGMPNATSEEFEEFSKNFNYSALRFYIPSFRRMTQGTKAN